MKISKIVFPSHFISCCIFCILLCGLFSCQRQVPRIQPSVDQDLGILPPTQRPYTIKGITYYPLASSEGYRATGIASWYGPCFHGKKTSNGEPYDMYGPTAAHKTLPMNTVLLVENLENGRKTVVRINDRGPFIDNRIIDLSYSEAQKLGIVRNGTAKVRLTAMPADASVSGLLAQKSTEPSPPPVTAPQQQVQEPIIPRYYVQIGSYTEAVQAHHQQKRFVDAGFNAGVEPYLQNKEHKYRVLVDVGTERNYAEQAEQVLLKKGYDEAFLLTR